MNLKSLDKTENNFKFERLDKMDKWKNIHLENISYIYIHIYNDKTDTDTNSKLE